MNLFGTPHILLNKKAGIITVFSCDNDFAPKNPVTTTIN